MASRLTLHNLHKITVQVQSATALSVVFVYKECYPDYIKNFQEVK